MANDSRDPLASDTHPTERRAGSLSVLARYGGAVVAVAAATAVRWLLGDVLGTDAAFVTFYPAVAVTALAAGGGPGVLATVLSAAAVSTWLIHSDGLDEAVLVGLFVAAGLVVSGVTELLHRRNEQFRALVADLREREERLDLIVRHYPGMVARVDRDLRYRYASPRYEEWFGVPPAAVLGRTIAEVIGPTAYGRAEPFIALALAGEPVTFENQITLPAGRSWWVQATFVPATGGDGAVQGFFIFAADISERKQVEVALRAEKEYAQSIVETLHTPLLILHPDLTVKGVNPAFYDHFRVDPENTVGRKIYQLGNAQWDIPALRTLLEGVLPANSVFNDYEVTHDFESIGRRVMLVNGRRLDDVQLILLGIRDVTEQKEAAERQAFLLRFSDSLRPLADPNEVKTVAAHILGEHLVVNRAFYAEVEGDNWMVVRGYEQGITPLPDGPYSAGTYGHWVMQTYRAGGRIVFRDTRTDPRFAPAEQEAHAAAGIVGAVGVPLVKGGKLVAILAVHTAAPRDWTDGDIGLVEETAQRTWAAVERAKAEAALRAGEERLRLAVRASNIGLWDWDLKTGVVAYSPEWKAQLGYAEDEIRDEFAEWETRVHPDDRGPTLDRSRRAIAAAEVYYEVEFRLRHKDGSWRWIFARAEVIRGAGGAALRVLGCHLDVTRRKQVEVALREREAWLAAILNTAADAVITIDRAGVIESVNRAAERMFGYTAAELVGGNVSVLMPPPYRDQHDEYLARYVSTGEPRIIGVGRELAGRRKDGSTFPIELAVSEIDHEMQFTGIIRDVTRRKELEREVVEIASLQQRRIGQDLHDTVGQELTALNLLGVDLSEAVRSDPAAARLAKALADGLRRCQRDLRVVLRGLLPVPIDVEGLMASLADLTDRTSRDHAVACTFDCPEPVEVADNLTATHLYLIAQEAVHNAVKHARPRSVRVRLTAAPVLTLRVEDDGVGLPPDPPDGLGLRIMRNRAALIGARFAVGPAAPTGTVVTCELIGGGRG